MSDEEFKQLLVQKLIKLEEFMIILAKTSVERDRNIVTLIQQMVELTKQYEIMRAVTAGPKN
jgi:hypothetical protein